MQWQDNKSCTRLSSIPLVISEHRRLSLSTFVVVKWNLLPVYYYGLPVTTLPISGPSWNLYIGPHYQVVWSSLKFWRRHLKMFCWKLIKALFSYTIVSAAYISLNILHSTFTHFRLCTYSTVVKVRPLPFLLWRYQSFIQVWYPVSEGVKSIKIFKYAHVV